MAIDDSGKWWKGESFEDLAEYIRLLTEEGEPADTVVQSRCACGKTAFQLLADGDEGCARRTCVACGTETFIADSEEIWEDAEPRRVRCVCGKNEFELAVGFSLREGGGDVKWITLGQRCLACGVLASAVDWKIDYSPSLHLLEKG